jgi:hypothetical protein
MHILAELETQRKALLEKGEEVPSHMVEPSFEELMAGRVQPSPNETPEEKEKRISAFWLMVVEFLAPKVRGAKGWEADMCSIPLQQTNFTASDETMTKLALENMWRQWHAAPGSMETKERGRYTRQGINQKGMGLSQEGIDQYNELFKETVLNQKESWANDFEMDVVESLQERHYRNASLEEIRQSKTRKRCKLGAVDGEVRKKAVSIWDESEIVAV